MNFAFNWIQNIAVITHTYDELNNPILFKDIDGLIGFAWDFNEDTKNVTENSAPILNLLKPYEKKQYSFWMERYINT